MADKEIGELTDASALAGGEVFHLTQSGNSRKATLNQVWDFIKPKAKESFLVALSDETTAITTGTAKATFRMPYAFRLTGVRLGLSTSSSSGTVTVNIKKNGSTIFTTKVTINSGSKTSVGATAYVFVGAGPPAYIDFADDDEVTFDIDGAGTGAKGLKVALIGQK